MGRQMADKALLRFEERNAGIVIQVDDLNCYTFYFIFIAILAWKISTPTLQGFDE